MSTVVISNTRGRDLLATAITDKRSAQAPSHFHLAFGECGEAVVFSERALLITEQGLTKEQLEALSKILYG